jgi:membrane protease subunit (stomatin/prohibitin family)
MAKFVIECPSCGRYAEARKGFFARKKIDCSCGHTINVKTDKLTSRKCSYCGNDVVFDQSKGEKALCPVCHEPINELADKTKVEEFSCLQCGVRLLASKGATTYTCPVCDNVNDVQECLVKEKIKKDGLASIIKYEGDNETLIWKHPIEDFNLGSQLIVHESQEAIFFKDGQALDLFGAGRYTLETQQLPMLEKLYKLPTDTEGTFHSEVYYINMTTQMGIKWGTDSKVRLFDPMSGMHIEIGACGSFDIRVTNSRKLLLKIVGTTDKLSQSQLLGSKDSKGYFRTMIMTQVKAVLAQVIKENQINILEIDSHIITLSELLKERINVYLSEYGLEVVKFFVSSIMTPDDDPNFKRMKQQYADQYLKVREEEIRRKEAEAAAERKTVEAQTAARMKIIGAQGEAEALKIQKAAEAESYKMQAEAEATEMRMKGYTYQQETARQVGLEAMQNGITGGSSSSGGGLGDVASLGVTLGAMGGVINMTKDAINPIIDSSQQIGTTFGNVVNSNSWNCSCGTMGITGNFCTNCGSKRPDNNTWDCSCGAKGITGNFCTNCGAKRPDKVSASWDCKCGNKNITGNFCGNCGAKRGE